jgi:hypothetical protein
MGLEGKPHPPPVSSQGDFVGDSGRGAEGVGPPRLIPLVIIKREGGGVYPRY